MLVVLVPVFTLAFVPDAEKRMDAAVLRQIETDIAASSNMSPEEKEAELEFFRRMPISRIMASWDAPLAPLQEMFAPMRATYAVFQWMERIAWSCLITVAITLLVVGVSVALSLRSQIAQYRALRIGWPVLRTSAVIQVVGQAVLIVALMYWAGGLWLNFYVPYLILLPVIIAGYGVHALVKAILRKVEDDHPIPGEVVAKAAAPELWERIESIAKALGTDPPDRLVAGIEPSFFVTEHPVTVAGTRLEGRTLFVSLPMLKIMSVEEADAVLGHELAHFSGEDTLWSRRISPLLGKFEIYLQALYSGLFVPVARFMHFFWDLYFLSLRRLRRVREFRADAVGSTVNSPAAMARALVKVSSYCDYRTKTEQGIIEKPAVESDLQLASQLEQGYPGFLSAFASDGDSMKSGIIHPFDAHPPMAERIRKLGFGTLEILQDAELQAPPQRTWYDAIQQAGELESVLWAKREDELQKYHGLAIAYRVLPETEDEIAAVERHFPRLIFQNAKGDTATLDYRSLRLSTSELEVPFSEISVMSLEKVNDKPQLKITHMTPDQEKTVTEKFFPCEFLCEEGNLLQLFEKYYGRHTAVRPGASGK
ncbi:MAG: M48 family metallopeptidase [Verrucomicrobiota bacterium]